ncbi:hypothetical protein M3Y97_00159500 [Aphelenchoides bicaudatus]|nr:hypothetical protein M3Y97_00159500 [Aphelenchoides bicaudatus]
MKAFYRLYRSACVLFSVIAFFVLTFFVFFQPYHVNYYLPKNSANVKSEDSNPYETFQKSLRHRVPQRAVHQLVKHVYPPRRNMEECKPLFGRIGIFVAVNTDHGDKLYKIAQASLQCYLKSTPYKYFYIDIDKDVRTLGRCNQTNVYYKRHCVAAHYLHEVDWMLFLDGDIGVVNPNHCVEEWIDDRVDMIFYERFFKLMKNTEKSKRFLLDFANMEYEQFEGFTGYDNGVLQILILQAALPGAIAEIKACDAIYKRSKTLEQYYNYVTCVKLQLGASRVFPGSVRIYRRAHGWARDSKLAGNKWSDSDFMFHSWKASELNSTWFDADVFTKIPNPKKCSRSLNEWNHRPELHVQTDLIKQELSAYETGIAQGYPKEGRDIPHLMEPDVRECYPDCDKYT